jgi:hypothetical protein
MARERAALSKFTPSESLTTKALKKAYVLARLCLVLDSIIRYRRIDLWMTPTSDNWQVTSPYLTQNEIFLLFWHLSDLE